MKKIERELLSVKEASEVLGVHERTVWSFTEDGEDPIPTYRIGRLRKIDRGELKEWIQRRRQKVEPTRVARIVEDVLKGLGR